MPKLPDDSDPTTWHRHFAMESNNRAWDLAARSRTPAEDRDMLNAAHAAAFHWGAIGTELHHARAAMLLAEVHALLGMGDSAFEHAEEVRDFFREHDAPDWEMAFVHTIHAHAASAAGKPEQHRASYLEAKQAIEAISDDEDRKIVLQTFDQVPTP